MAVIKPQKRAAFGRDSWGFAPLVADLSAPKITELNAVSGLNLSCFLQGEQEGITGTTEKVALTRLLCETETYEFTGTTTFAMADLMAAFDPQAAAGSDGKKAWEVLEDHIEGVLWRRLGIPIDNDLEVGQFVDLVPVQLGRKTPTKSATDAGGITAFTQSVAITASPVFNVAIVAGS